ncbi:uncharacterized protein IWZ02DRAFT_51014 [Phyllosticta citriasiana]|uniref:uncharacterized protein n=1 Tax=Phyllosticta citriasiana TaxID=595635 RepID=UPI0030FD3F86
MPSTTNFKDDSSPSPLPYAEPMSRTDSGFEDNIRRSMSKRSLAIKSTPLAADNGYEDPANVSTKSLQREDSVQDALDELPRSPSISDRPALRKRRSRPSSKHSRSSRESSATHRRPSLSINRYRTAPDRVFTRQDIDEVLALHTRSCNLFQSFSVPPSAPHSPGLSSIGSRYSMDIPRVNMNATAPGQRSRTSPQQSITPELASHRSDPSPATSTFSRPSGAPSPTLLPVDPEDEEPSTPTIPATTMHWNSPSTRRREYAEIDRSTRGLRGLVRRLTPKCFSTRHLQPFYDEKKAARGDDDTASVRRYRIDLPDEEGNEEKKGYEEVSVRPKTAPGRFGKGMLRGWGCGLKGT